MAALHEPPSRHDDLWPVPAGIILPDGVVWDGVFHTFYRSDGSRVPGVGTVLRATGLVQYAELEPAHLDYVLTRGKFVHELTGLIDRDELDMAALDKRLRPYAQAYMRFLDRSHFVVRENEQAVLQEDGLWWGYYDKSGDVGDQELILDVKTNDVRTADHLQLAAYAMAARKREATRAVLVLERTGDFYLRQTPDPDAADLIFRSAALTYRYRQAEGLL